MTDPIFCYDYYKNAQFQRCLRNYKKYINYEGEDAHNDQLMAEWEELLLKDFYVHAKEWLNNNRNNEEWWSDLR